MFTGIITHQGSLTNRRGNTFSFAAPQDLLVQLKIGSSIAISGVCLTVIKKTKKDFAVNVMPETMRKTILSDLQKNAVVNLELPLHAMDRFEGHIVQGHIDGVGTITSIIPEGNSHLFHFQVSKELCAIMVSKGSVAVNGISLTLIDVGSTWFTVGIIPYTYKHTMLGCAKVGDKVNIETDILVKYINQLLQKTRKENI